MNVADMTAEQIEARRKSFDALALSIERCAAALEALNGAGHGGINFVMVGELAECTVKPPRAVAVREVSGPVPPAALASYRR